MSKKIVLAAIIAIALSSFVILCLKVPAEPGGRVHNSRTGEDFETIQEAINDSDTKDGDTIIIDPGTFYENVIMNKSLVIWGAGQGSTIIDGKVLEFAISASDEADFSVKRLTVINAACGIRFVNCSAVKIQNVSVNQCTFGIDLNKCYDCTITFSNVTGFMPMKPLKCGINTTDCLDMDLNHNVVSDSTGTGISVSGSRIRLSQNELSKNKYSLEVGAPFLYDIDKTNTVNGKPVYYLVGNDSESVKGPIAGGSDIGFMALVNCFNMTVEGLNLTKNGVGILLVNTAASVINTSLCQDNREGIRLINSSNNTIHQNTVDSSYSTGINIETFDSVGNKIYHNVISNNNPNAHTVNDGNDWDDGYPKGGNYWSDGNHTDVKTGPGQNEPGSDLICDQPYRIDLFGRDQYPLVQMPKIPGKFNVIWNGTTYVVTVVKDAPHITNFAFDGQAISFEAIGGTFCNITMPRELLDGSLCVSLDGLPIASISTWDQDSISTCIEYGPIDTTTIRVLGEFVCKPPMTVFPDLNSDGKIDILDIFVVAIHFGEP